MDIKPFVGLGGVLIAVMASEFNDLVTAMALADVRGALGIGYDPGTWIQSLYVWAEIVGMAISPWLAVTFTLRRWTLFSIALCGTSGVLIPFCPNVGAIYALRLLQGLAGGLIIPLLMTMAFRVLTPGVRLPLEENVVEGFPNRAGSLVLESSLMEKFFTAADLALERLFTDAGAKGARAALLVATPSEKISPARSVISSTFIG